MSRVFPLIRAAAVFPLLRWMRASGHAVTARLTAAGLGGLHEDDAFRPVPLHACIVLFSDLAKDGPPDLGCRAVTPESILEIAIISRIGLGAATPGKAMMRISAAMPYHCTHEQLTLGLAGDAMVLRDRIAVPMDVAARHLVHQYVAMMALRICEAADAPDPVLRQVDLMPHPDVGVAHLVPWLGAGVKARPGDTLAVTIARSNTDRPFSRIVRPRMPTAQVAPLRGDGTLAASVRLVLPSLLAAGATPALGEVAALAGMSRRTLQRRLAAEGTSLSDLVEEARRDEALRRLGSSGEPLADLSLALGYAQQSALTRAVRRWTGQAPSRLRLHRTA